MAFSNDFSMSSSLPAGRTDTTGWRARRFGDFMNGRLPAPSSVKRWDGAAKNCSDWDGLRRDTELWFRSGNCLIHLYGKGQSRRGPAFKVPFSSLLAAKCHPLVERFVGSGILPASPSSFSSDGMYDYLDRWAELNPTRRVDLFIPAPPGADKGQSFLYHLATRNLIAWVFQRSLVGDHLGGALVALLSSLHEFRLPGEDHVGDLVAYLDEEGYLDMRGQPNHALAVLHLAEHFQLREMYIDAFAHCTGMNERLFLSSEFQHTSSVSRRLIRRARVDMDLRLSQAGTMLRTFLEDELSEAHLGLSAGARGHLERFRSFVLAFYTTRLGYYPPASIDTRNTIFEPEIYRVMHDDFAALYELLVDESFTSAESTPQLAQGGICAIQSVHSFDLRYRYKPLDHPLPLLPEVTTSQNPRRMSWMSMSRGSGGDKLKPDQRLLAHAALIKASNSWKAAIMGNELVRAYRRFEEESIAANRVDRAEKVNLVDARKVRWILIYAIYQVLRSVVLPPPEVRDSDDLDYNLGISTTDLPPWREDRVNPGLLRRHTGFVSRTPSLSTSGGGWSSPTSPMQAVAEIKPDVDYFAITHKLTRPARSRPPISNSRQTPKTTEAPKARSRSLTRVLSASSTIRRSLSVFRRDTLPPIESPSRKSAGYHEIVVLGYGNGTNPCRTPSNASSSGSGSESNLTTGTSASSAPPISPKGGGFTAPQWTGGHPAIPPRGRRREVVSCIGARSEEALPTRTLRPSKTPFSASLGNLAHGGTNYAAMYEELVVQGEQQVLEVELSPSPLRIRKGDTGGFRLPEDPDTWTKVGTLPREGDIMQQFGGLGGHMDIGAMRA